MRPLAPALAIALLSLITACGGSSSTPPTSSSSAATGSSSSAAASVLTGTVGEGDAYEIKLVDSTGAPVTSLKAGNYEVKVRDASKIHNFHLSGPGVQRNTTVAEITDVTWTVALSPGTYTFKCDPHAKMTGTFTVT